MTLQRLEAQSALPSVSLCVESKEVPAVRGPAQLRFVTSQAEQYLVSHTNIISPIVGVTHRYYLTALTLIDGD